MSIDVKQRFLKHPRGQVVSAPDQEVLDSNPSGGGNELMTAWGFIAQSLSLSPFHRINMT